MEERFRWLRRRPKSAIALTGVLLFAALNGMAFFHAYSMTHFVRGGEKPRSPSELSALERATILVCGVQIPRPENAVTPVEFSLPFETVRFASGDGATLEGWSIPHESPRGVCIFFHGYTSSKSTLLREAAAIHSLGYRVLLVDFRGSGGSDGNETTLGFREADDVLASVEFARAKWDDDHPILYGQSMGSAAILRAIAVHGVEPAALLLECPFDRLLTTVKNRFTAMRVPSFPAAHCLVFWGGVQHGYWGFAHNPIEYAANVRCPVLLLHGAADQDVTCSEAEAFFANLPQPKRMVLFDGVGHRSYLAVRPNEWSAAVENFLAKLPGANMSLRQEKTD